MSINVTVKGNPISIKRGKMVTADPYKDKSEFDKRRLMRLEQVRQQSKDIAEDVRNRVRKEKKKHLGAIEREGEEQLKNWQNRKLLELQNQYEEALSEFGSGHKSAEKLADESEIIDHNKKANAYKAKIRGEEAAARLQIDKNTIHYEKAKPIQQKKLARDVENTRAALITKMKQKTSPAKRKRTRKKATADINISIPVAEDEVETPDTNMNSNFEQNEEENTSSSSASASDDSIEQIRGENKKSKSDVFQPQERRIYDTRISDRIRRREYIASQPEYVDSAVKIDPVEVGTYTTRVRDHIYSRPPLPTYEFDEFSDEPAMCKCKCYCDCKNYIESNKENEIHRKAPAKLSTSTKSETRTEIPEQIQLKASSSKPETRFDIPEKAPVKLKTVATSTKTSAKTSRSDLDSQKVQYFDHSNKFVHSKSYPSGSFVEKVDQASIEVIPDVPTETDIQEKMKQRDREAHLRGIRALEKEKIQKDYQELMHKLPLLQKQERIAEINRDKPEYHMSDDRLKEMNRIRQNKIENAYSKLRTQREPAIVTLPKRVLNPEETETPPTVLNVGKWNADFNPGKMFTAEEVQQIIDSFNNKSGKDRRKKLKALLKDLKYQKAQLLNELKSLPKDDSITELMEGLAKLDSMETLSKGLQKRKRTESSSSNENGLDVKQISEDDKKNKHRNRRRRYSVSTDASPRKKLIQRDVLILQNMSTQTTPRTSDKDEKKKESNDKQMQTSSNDIICNKLHVSCDCRKLKQHSAEEVCEIVIKINDENSPKIIVKEKETSPIKDDSKSKVKDKKTRGKTQPSDNIPDIPKDVPSERRKLWKDELSKNSISASSTSYFSPPEFSSTKGDVTSTKNLSSLAESRTTNATLIKYVKKLLSMSKGSVDNLTVSSSEVPTPSQSVIELETNNPVAQLHEIIKYFHLKVEDLTNEYSSSESTVKSVVSSNDRNNKMEQADVKIKDKSKKTQVKKSNDVAIQYSDVAKSCSKRIADLAFMIQKLREDKENLIHSSKSSSNSTSDNEHFEGNDASTKYLNLPDLSKTDSKKSASLSSSSSTSSINEEELNRKILEVDFELAGKLKKSSTEGKTLENNNSDQELLLRLQRLMNKRITEPQQESEPKSSSEPESFVPLLVDIPKLPKLEMPPKNLTFSNNHKRPPTSKGIEIAKRLNGNISVVPHELSTIVEADSQLSTKLDVVTPVGSQIDLNEGRIENKNPSIEGNTSESSGKSLPDIVTEINELPSTSKEASSKDLNKNLKDPIEQTKDIPETLNPNSSSSNEEAENIETILRNIGMAWAIPTLHKTREALALTSTSTSAENSSESKLQYSADSSGSDVNLSAFLKKKILKKVSSTAMKSDTTPQSMFEVSELSSIQGNLSIEKSMEKSKQRTSTPIISSKSTNISKTVTFTDDSEISSVRASSKDEKSFYSFSGDSQSKNE